MIFIVFDKTCRGFHCPFHSIEATQEDADRVVADLRATTTSTAAKSLIYWEKREFGEVW